MTAAQHTTFTLQCMQNTCTSGACWVVCWHRWGCNNTTHTHLPAQCLKQCPQESETTILYGKTRYQGHQRYCCSIIHSHIEVSVHHREGEVRWLYTIPVWPCTVGLWCHWRAHYVCGGGGREQWKQRRLLRCQRDGTGEWDCQPIISQTDEIGTICICMDGPRSELN